MDNYTGPYISNGRFQPSVEFGDADPLDFTDFNSRLHDSAFAHFEDARHRTAADWIYSQFLAQDDTFKSRAVRDVPFYGNLLSPYLLKFGLLGAPSLIAGLLDVGLTQRSFKTGGYDREIADVLKYYQTDPNLRLRAMGGALTTAVYPDWYGDHGIPGFKDGKPIKVPAEATVLPPIPAADPAPAPTPRPETKPTNPTTLPPLAPKEPTKVDQLVNAVSVLGADNLRTVMDAGESDPRIVYHPYKPLRPLVRRPPDARQVALYNKYHKNKITLAEAIEKFYG